MEDSHLHEYTFVFLNMTLYAQADGLYFGYVWVISLDVHKFAMFHASFWYISPSDPQDCGVHGFIVQLRSLKDHTPMAGIELGDIGPKGCGDRRK